MRQEVEDCHWNCSSDVENNYQPNSPSMDSSLKINSSKLSHHSSSESSISSEQSVPSDTVDSDNAPLYVKSKLLPHDREITINSDEIKLHSSDTEDRSAINANETFISGNKFNDIIEKIVELKFSSDNIDDDKKLCAINNNKNLNNNNNNFDEKISKINTTYKNCIIVASNLTREEKKLNVNKNEENDDDLRVRGPVRPLSNQPRRKPYCQFSGSSDSVTDMQQSYSLDIESTAQQIMSISNYSDLLIPCLDKLEGTNNYSSNVSDSEWILNNYDCDETNAGDNSCDKKQQIPAIIINENSLTSEESLIEKLNLQGFQSAQSDVSSYTNPSPVFSENWPDSPTSANSYNVMSSRSHSRASSRAHSPGSSANIGSPSIPNHFTSESPPDFSNRLNNWRVPTSFSSSSSSNHSFGDTSSPSNYQQSLDLRVKDQLEFEFADFSPWYGNCESSSTIVNSTDNPNDIDTFGVLNDNIQVVLNVVTPPDSKAASPPRDQKRRYDFNENKNDLCSVANNGGINLGNTASLIASAQNDLNGDFNKSHAVTSYNITQNIYQENLMNTEEEMNFEEELERHLLSSFAEDNIHNNKHYSNESLSTSGSVNNYSPEYNDFSSMYGTENQSSPSVSEPCFNNSWNSQQNIPFNDFQIPETVSSFRHNRYRRNSLRNIAPWPSLNLPQTAATKKLKDQLDPRDVEKAMRHLLKKSTEYLSAQDKDGDTLLMCLVGNPHELEKWKAYLMPMVERIRTLDDGLSLKNNREEDVLYLAAVNCPQMPEVTGYLAAVMMQAGIDISQQLYRRRGDTLIHAVVAHGDKHLPILQELLTLKTSQGNSVFDLSKSNYAGRTPLHVAAEVHDPQGSGINSVNVVRLLLANGADPKIKESTCGNTALHLAVSVSCDPALVKVLLMKNGREAVNIQNRNNNTALHMAAAASNNIQLDKQMNVCSNLIKAGGLTNIINQHGCTPLALVPADRKKFISASIHTKENIL
ncbi:putative uncharacterized protein DDB_G0282133 isoform X1 [Cotesia glomerata]|uniref:putative uncharacterized protein DDB_G0282133 isoform X1 n=1 Tax=Cotesia glomerata TaxID=32391 RepID=UPI001D015211|nr:putative uncharacterized protein DDB_G0282133 isoform X1 [Cotesia glomerata]XP_044586896.1 putative uncharacterized protein DDB_G0282133 isoform X1 [Cotesia glomerata]